VKSVDSLFFIFKNFHNSNSSKPSSRTNCCYSCLLHSILSFRNY